MAYQAFAESALGLASHQAPALTWCGWTAIRAARRRWNFPRWGCARPICRAGRRTRAGNGKERHDLEPRCRRRRPRTTCAGCSGLPSLVLFGLVYMVPLTVFTTYGIVTETTGGRLPLAYLVTAAAMVFTARSYARMSGAYPVAGSAYTYTQKTFGAPVGFLAGWSLLLDYLFLPMINYLVIGIYLQAALPAIAALGVHRGCHRDCDGAQHHRHRLGGRANFVIIAVQVIFIVVFVVLALS